MLSVLSPRWLPAAVAALALFAPGPARAAPEVTDETRNAARELGNDGVAAYQAGQHERALDLLRRAFALVPAPTIGLYEARTLAKLGRLVEAVERYQLVRRTVLEPGASPAFRDAVRDAEREGEEVRARVPRMRLKVQGEGSDSPELELTLDGRPYPKALLDVDGTLNPGAHVVAARVPGVSHAEEKITVDERRSYVVSLRLLPGDPSGAAAPTDPPGPGNSAVVDAGSGGSQKTWGWVALGVGSAGVALGVVAGLGASSKKSDLDDQCPNGSCPPSARSDHDSWRTWNTLSLVGYGAGIVGLGVGAILILTAPEPAPAERAKLTPWLGPRSAGVMGSF